MSQSVGQSDDISAKLCYSYAQLSQQAPSDLSTHQLTKLSPFQEVAQGKTLDVIFTEPFGLALVPVTGFVARPRSSTSSRYPYPHSLLPLTVLSHAKKQKTNLLMNLSLLERGWLDGVMKRIVATCLIQRDERDLGCNRVCADVVRESKCPKN